MIYLRILQAGASVVGLYCLAHEYWVVMTFAFTTCVCVDVVRWLYK